MLFTLTAGVTLSTPPQPYLWKGALLPSHPPPPQSPGWERSHCQWKNCWMPWNAFPACPSFSEAPKSAPPPGSLLELPKPWSPLPLRPTFFSPWGHYTFRDPCHPLVELSCPLLSHLLVSLPGMSSHPLKKAFLSSTMDLKCQLFQEALRISLTGVDTSLPFQSLHSSCADLRPGWWVGVGSHRHPSPGNSAQSHSTASVPWSLVLVGDPGAKVGCGS